MGLFFKNKKSKFEIEIKGFEKGKEVKLKNGKKEEIKPLSYYKKLESEIKPLENILVGFSSSLKTIKNESDRIEVLTALIESFYNIKKKCNELGRDYEKYFSETWEHCHNSRNPDFSFVERFELELKELTKSEENKND